MNGYATGRGLKGNHGTMRYMAGTPYQILKLLKAHTSNCIILDCKLVVFFECWNPKRRRNYMILTLNLTWLISTKDRHKTYMQGHFDPPHQPSCYFLVNNWSQLNWLQNNMMKTSMTNLCSFQISVSFCLTHFFRLPKKNGLWRRAWRTVRHHLVG